MRTVQGSHGEIWSCEQVEHRHDALWRVEHRDRAQTHPDSIFVRCTSSKRWAEVELPTNWASALTDEQICRAIEHELAEVLGPRGRLLVDHDDVAWRVTIDDRAPGLAREAIVAGGAPALLFRSEAGEVRRLASYARCGIPFAQLSEEELLDLLHDATPHGRAVVQ